MSKKRRTPAQQEASRRNGTKSRGPQTPAGKANSSRNRYTHGLLSKTLLLIGEDARRFSALFQNFRKHFQPANTLEEGLVEELALCRWRQRRALGLETTLFNAEMHREAQTLDPTIPDTNAQRAARAFNSLSGDNRKLDLANRYELRYARHFNRTLQRLEATQQTRQKLERNKNEEVNLRTD